MKKIFLLPMILSAVVLSACNSTIHRSVDIDGGEGLALDAKQRLMLVTDNGGYHGDRRVVCAEPSPDAITSLASALSASGGVPEAGGALGFGSSEAVASIGLRTQTIQLLRDGYYRLCEAYLNGAISRQQYTFALVNIDRAMVPLMVIDAIAGTPRPPAVTIAPGVPGSESSATLTAGTPGEATGSGAQPASAETEGGTDSTTPSLAIESVSQSRTGLNAEEAKVLDKALDMVSGHSAASLCMVFLADPYFIEADAPDPRYQHEIAAACADFMKAQMVPQAAG